MNYKMMQGMILVTWGGGVVVGSPQGDSPISTVHAYVTKEISLVVWGGGVVVGSPQGTCQYQPCTPMRLRKYVTNYILYHMVQSSTPLR